MNDLDGVAAIKTAIGGEFERRKTMVYALCKMYAGLVLQRFRQKQAQDKFWHNRTNTAYDTVFSDAEVVEGAIYFFLAHTVEYGVYLELANDRKHESLRPTVMAFYSRFTKDLEALYAA